MKNYPLKHFINNVLNGMSTGVIITLVPPALIGEIAKAFNLTILQNIATMTQNYLSIIIGLCVAMRFKLTPIQTGTVAITTAIGSGAVDINNGVATFIGIGDVINASLTAALAVFITILIGDKLKSFTILILPTLIITLVGFIGLSTLPFVSSITTYIGDMVNSFTELQPILMSILIAMSFAFLITSPVSSVAVATTISLTGISAGAANLGATAACFGLGILGLRANGFATAFATTFGSPKLQMANQQTKNNDSSNITSRNFRCC